MKWDRHLQGYILDRGESVEDLTALEKEKIFNNMIKLEKRLGKAKLTHESQAYTDLQAKQYLAQDDNDLMRAYYQFQADPSARVPYVRNQVNEVQQQYTDYINAMENKRLHINLFDAMKWYLRDTDRVDGDKIFMGGQWLERGEEFDNWFFRQWKKMDTEARAMLFGYDTGGGEAMEQFATFESERTSDEDPYEILDLFTSDLREDISKENRRRANEYAKERWEDWIHSKEHMQEVLARQKAREERLAKNNKYEPKRDIARNNLQHYLNKGEYAKAYNLIYQTVPNNLESLGYKNPKKFQSELLETYQDYILGKEGSKGFDIMHGISAKFRRYMKKKG